MHSPSNDIATYPLNTSLSVAVPTQPLRLGAMDLQRGLIMILMAFSHCREYVGSTHYKNNHWGTPSAWQSTSLIDLFEQIFVATVASGFCMIMGIGIVLLCQSRLREAWSIEKVCAYLIKRGIVLILLQLTLLQLFEVIAERQIYFYAGVIMMLGWCMILAALVLYFTQKLKTWSKASTRLLDYLVPITLIVGIITILQMFMTSLITQHSHPSLLEDIFVVGDKFYRHIAFDINFTPLPWFPAVLFGLIIGQLLHDFRAQAFKIIGYLGLSFLGAWILLRTANLIGFSELGSYKLAPDKISFMSFFCTSKYPPSLVYFLGTLSFNLLGLSIFYRIEQTLPRLLFMLQPLRLFGQCALFFFVMHWFVYYGYSLLLGEKLTLGGSLICMWLLGLFTLYPFCKMFRELKSSKPADSLWRLF